MSKLNNGVFCLSQERQHDKLVIMHGKYGQDRQVKGGQSLGTRNSFIYRLNRTDLETVNQSMQEDSEEKYVQIDSNYT